MSRHFAIERDDSVGFYVFDGDRCVRDYLQDTLEMVNQQAFEDFGVPKKFVEEGR